MIDSDLVDANDRYAMWTEFLRRSEVRRVLELGVYEGELAEVFLREVPTIEEYYMLDPWRHLDDWNKPANQSDESFEVLLQTAMRRTDFAADKRTVLRGTTTQVIDQIPDGSLDFAYIDGDHTLRGISIDLVRTWPKVREGGWVGGDDFTASVFQHDVSFEPTLVFPFAVHFAEAVGARIYGLPHSQFLMERGQRGFEFVDLSGAYATTELGPQFRAFLERRYRGQGVRGVYRRARRSIGRRLRSLLPR